MNQAGAQGEIQQLVDDHYQSLYRFAFRLCGSAADAEDLTQEAFCKAQAKLSQLRDRARAKPWLFRILRNAYLHGLRTDRHQRCIAGACLEDVPEPSPDPLPPVDAQRLQETLNELPEAFRTPILLYYFEEFSYRDIAEHMDLPMGTVMSRLARAKAHLRSRLLAPAAAALAEDSRRATNGL